MYIYIYINTHFFIVFKFDVALGEMLLFFNWLGQIRVHHWIPRCWGWGSGCSLIGRHFQGWWSEGISPGDATPLWGRVGEGNPLLYWGWVGCCLFVCRGICTRYPCPMGRRIYRGGGLGLIFPRPTYGAAVPGCASALPSLLQSRQKKFTHRLRNH